MTDENGCINYCVAFVIFFSFSEDCKPKKCPGDGFQGKRCKCWCRGSADNIPVEECEKEGNIITLTRLCNLK